MSIITNNKLLQYNLSGEIIKCWDNINVCVYEMNKKDGIIIPTDKYEYKSLNIAARSEKVIYKGYIWKYEIKTQLPNEEFKSLNIINCDNYELSNKGRIYNKKLNKFIPQKIHKLYNYVLINLVNNYGKNRKYILHNLMIRIFLTNNTSILKSYICKHIDNNKLNNELSNLKLIKNINTTKIYNKKLNQQNVYQYNCNMVLIKIWDNINQIIQNNEYYNKSSIQTSCNKLTMYKQYYWRYKEINLLINEKFVHIKNFENYKISNYGRVVNKYNILIDGIKIKGILKYKLYYKNHKKSYNINQLLLDHF